MTSEHTATTERAVGRTLHRSGRALASAVLAVLTVVGLLASTAAFWARSVVFEEDRWISTVRDLPRQDDIAIALSDYLTEQLFLAVDFEQRVEDALPAEVAIIVPVLTSAIQGFVADETATFIESDRFERMWVDANRQAHRALIAILEDQSVFPTLERTDDTVTLNLVPAVNAVLDQIDDVASDVVGSDIAIPEIPDDQGTRESIRALSARLGVDLPGDFGQITIYQGDRLPQPRDTLVLIERVRVLIAVATVVLGLLAIAVSPNRRRTILGLLLGSAGGFALLLAVPGTIADQVGRLITDAQDRAAATEAIHVVFGSYLSLYRWLVATALVSAGVILVTGPSGPARRLRFAGREQLERFSLTADAATYVRRYVTWLRVGGPVVGTLFVVLFTRRSLTALFVLFALVTAWEALLSLVPRPDERTASGSEPARRDGDQA